jgi:hypothetical protein
MESAIVNREDNSRVEVVGRLNAQSYMWLFGLSCEERTRFWIRLCLGRLDLRTRKHDVPGLAVC